MTRRPAAARHQLPEPSPEDDLVDVLIAFHHPTRRWLTELLGVHGPQNVGQLARRTGLAVGSVSHHLKALYARGFIEPAPDLARDTRESWWRLTPRPLVWTADDFEGPARQVADVAERENFRHQVRATRQWLEAAGQAPEEWRRAASATDALVAATLEQTEELSRAIAELVTDWSRRCTRDAETHPDAVRRPVRAVCRVFPSAPVRP